LLEDFDEELPYKWKVRVVGWTPYLNGTLRIDAEVLVLTQVQQGMVIGRNGRSIKKLIHKSTKILEDLYRRPIDLRFQPSLMDKSIRKAVKKGK